MNRLLIFLYTVNVYVYFIALCSCTKKFDDLNLPKQNDKPVINCLFTSDSVFSVFVSRSTTIFSAQFPAIDNYTLKLYENGIFKENLKQEEPGKYKSTIKPIERNVYSVKLLNADSLVIAEAADTLPAKVSLDCASVRFTGIENSEGLNVYEATICFKDLPNKKNFYEIIVFIGKESFATNYASHDELIVDEIESGNFYNSPTSMYFSDANFNGKYISPKANYTIGISGGNDYEIFYTHKILFKAISSNYYQYKKTLFKHFNNQQIQTENLDFLFKGPPINLYSNVQNGYGIFAGYSQIVQNLKPAK